MQFGSSWLNHSLGCQRHINLRASLEYTAGQREDGPISPDNLPNVTTKTCFKHSALPSIAAPSGQPQPEVHL